MKIANFIGQGPIEARNQQDRQLIPRLMIIVIMTLVFIFFAPTLKGGFIWDDEYNLLNNPNFRGLSWSRLAWMFSTFHDGNYHPLSWMSLGLDFILWGMNPAGYHLTDLILHGVNSVLFYWVVVAILRRLSEKSTAESIAIQVGATLGALIFALHPLRVESVAWISTRGDTLCGVFIFLTLLAYFHIDENKTLKYKNKWFWLSLFFFACSLLSRAWGITLPVILLILDIYPLHRVRLKEMSGKNSRWILIEKIPFVLLAFTFGAFALLAKHSSMVTVSKHGILARFLQSFYGLCFYIWKTLVPLNLSPLYQLHDFNTSDPKYILCALAVLCATTGLFFLAHRCPWAITSWICYIVIISPLLGFVQSGPQIVADRYTYFACLPFAVLVAAGIKKLWLLFWKQNLTSRAWIAGFLPVAALLLLGISSYCQIGVWRDNLSFWDRIIYLDPQNEIAVNERARLKFEHIGDFAGAEVDYSHALRLNPKNVDALISRGLVRESLKKYKGAAGDFDAAERLDKSKSEIYNGRGLLYYQQGRLKEALQNYNKAISLNPKFADAYNNRGLLHKALGSVTAAIKDFDTAIHIDPTLPAAYVNRGMIMQEQNKFKQAVQSFAAALDVAPENWTFRQRIKEHLKHVYMMQKIPRKD